MVEIGPREKALAVRLAGLREGTNDKTLIAAAVGKLLRLGLAALLEKGALDAKTK